MPREIVFNKLTHWRGNIALEHKVNVGLSPGYDKCNKDLIQRSFKLPGDVSAVIPKQNRDELCIIQMYTFTAEVNLMKRRTPRTEVN